MLFAFRFHEDEDDVDKFRVLGVGEEDNDSFLLNGQLCSSSSISSYLGGAMLPSTSSRVISGASGVMVM